MREGRLEVRWTWLPYWLAVNPKLVLVIEREMRDRVLLGGVTTSEKDLDALHDFVRDRLQQQFKFPGLDKLLDALRSVEEPAPS